MIFDPAHGRWLNIQRPWGVFHQETPSIELSVLTGDLQTAIHLVVTGKEIPDIDASCEDLNKFLKRLKREMKAVKQTRKSLLLLEMPLTVENDIIEFAYDENNLNSAKKEIKKQRNESSMSK